VKQRVVVPLIRYTTPPRQLPSWSNAAVVASGSPSLSAVDAPAVGDTKEELLEPDVDEVYITQFSTV
jgi:hypothetical protein